ncbi:PGLP2 [Symbiodinium natans]|uniref:PGLP2 protein n=1 Tax=Symbiodinium natans TaxID=878477 RepID=A0A812TUP0_9DINO|nr:PGLP2 [Symbiodinium natans]
MAQKTKALVPPGEEAPCKLQKCSAEFAREKEASQTLPTCEEEGPDQRKAVEGGSPEESAAVPANETGSSQAASEISDVRLIAEVQSVLVGVDLQSMTLGQLRSRLEAKLGLTDGALSAKRRIRRRLSFVVHQEAS